MSDKHEKIIFVCTGNTCRSPMCEAVARQLYNVSAESRGLSADGSPISENAVRALTEKEYWCDPGRRSCQLTAADVAEADRIVTVTPSHAQIIAGALPQFAEKIESLPISVSDPYGGDLSDYRQCLCGIEAALAMLFGGTDDENH